MAQPPDARELLAAAEQAAGAGDLASADALLSEAARIQEATLGALHPDLVTTLNNRAIVAEQTGRVGDAEALYRRAVEIASAALPPDHPLLATSRQNLDDFCLARGLPIDAPRVLPPAQSDTRAALAMFARETSEAPDHHDVDVPPAIEATPPEPPPAAAPPSIPRSAPPAPPRVAQTTSRPRPAALSWVAIGVVVVVIAAVFALEPWSTPEEPQRPAPAPPAESRAIEPRQPPAAKQPPEPASIPQAQPSAAPRVDRPSAGKPPARAPSQASMLLDTADLCRSFSTAGSGAWRCETASDTVDPGSIVFYTRVKSQRDSSITHLWYRGDRLRQSVSLTIRANWQAGYRTYSRQTVDRGEWRVEVRSAAGELLHERRFAVR